jgi:GTP cyclohydrolase II
MDPYCLEPECQVAESNVRVACLATAALPTRYGHFQIQVFGVDGTDIEHVALIKGDISLGESIPVRLHSECLTGDLLGSYRCDCGEQLDLAMREISREGVGVLIYLRGHEGRGIGIANKIRAYALQESGFDTVDANRRLGLPDDAREYDSAASILRKLGITSVRLISNNPQKFKVLKQNGFACERISHSITVRRENENYVETKRRRFGHVVDEDVFQSETK